MYVPVSVGTVSVSALEKPAVLQEPDSRVADSGGSDPDQDPTVKKKRNRIRPNKTNLYLSFDLKVM